MRKLVVAAAVAAMLVVPAQASAMPHLSKGEAARALGQQLRQGFDYGAMSGSLDVSCWRVRRNTVGCYGDFVDLDGDLWEGAFRIRETYRSYWVRWDVSLL